MDLKEIQTLIKFISSSGVDEVAIEKKDFKINIKKNLPPVISPSVVHAQPALALAAPQAVAASSAPAAEVGQAQVISSGEEIKSPMIVWTRTRQRRIRRALTFEIILKNNVR